MLPYYVTKSKLRSFFRQAMAEDVGSGDHTSLSSLSPDMVRSAVLLIRDEGVLAGVEVAKYFFEFTNPTIQFTQILNDGQAVHKGDKAFVVTGPALDILRVERLVLNVMQRMSGIATLTREYRRQIEHTRTKLLDTRKTTPGFRMFEKWAVLLGGGVNHRYGLYDMILLKDNHVDFCGGVQKAIAYADNYLRKNNLHLKIEVEVRSLDEVKEALNTGLVHRILLDNMLTSTMQEAIRMINGQMETEASGGVNLNTIKQIAETGVDYISVGKLTHSFNSLDMSLKACTS